MRGLEPTLKSAPLLVNIVGDVDAEAIRQPLAAAFASLDKRKPQAAYQWHEWSRPKKTAEISRQVSGGEPRSLISYTFFTDDGADMADNRRRGMLASYIRDYLRTELRERLGAAYSQGAFHNGSLTHEGMGFLQCRMSVGLGHEGVVADMMNELIADLAAGKIDEQRFQLVREPLLKQVRQYRLGNGYWLQSVLSDAPSRPERLKWAEQMEGDYAAITVADLSALAKAIFQNKALKLTISGEAEDAQTVETQP